MEVFKKARIYKITSPNTDKVYIGATRTGLNRRFTMHNMCFRSWQNGKQHLTTSFKILECGDAKIELIEELKNVNKQQISEREAEAQRNTLHCVNKKREGRTPEQYYKDNRDTLLLRSKLRYWKNKNKKTKLA